MPAILSRALLQLTLPAACFWVWRQESIILRTGVPLTSELAADARRLGVWFSRARSLELRPRSSRNESIAPLHRYANWAVFAIHRRHVASVWYLHPIGLLGPASARGARI